MKVFQVEIRPHQNPVKKIDLKSVKKELVFL